jgi:hypothetical protein
VETLFPFGLPAPTATYLVLYLVTLVLHVVFMNYVLAGTAYLAAVTIFGDRTQDRPRPVYDLLRDWMPFMLSAAITAGVAPLLFVQVLYQKQFYTANLLLFNRWMALLPALMVGFYLLYALKSERATRFSLPLRFLIGGGALVCFAFTGWSWTENHLLSLDLAAWTEQYVSHRLLYHSPELAPRLALWFLGAIPTMAIMVGWQLWYAERRGAATTSTSRHLSILALAGLVLSAIAGTAYFLSLPAEIRSHLLGPSALPYLAAAIVGWAIQLAAWFVQMRHLHVCRTWLIVASVGCLAAIFGVTALREVRRMLAIDMTSLYLIHENAAKVGGLTVFLFFFLFNALAIAACILIVRRGLHNGISSEDAPK